MVRADFDARVLGLLRSPDDARGGIQSRLGFLLALNVFLLIVGWLMEIFAAIVVVVPLIVPLGHAFGIHPVHLGIIFVANLELGFLTPLAPRCRSRRFSRLARC
jgi:di/tricarboxylate transporter